MSTYIPIQNDDRPAYNRALACGEGFQKLLVAVSKTNALKEAGEEIKKYHEKFTLWAQRLHVFSDNRVSLDSRLEDYPDGPTVVSMYLKILRHSLRRSFWFKTPTSSEDVKFQYKPERLARTLSEMHFSVDELLSFSDTMHQCHTLTLAAKAKTFDLNVDPSEITKFEEKTRQLLRQHPRGIQSMLADRLTMGIAFRRIRILYETTHNKKLQSRPYLPLPVFDQHAMVAAQDTAAESNPSPLDLPSTTEAEANVSSTTTDSPTDTSDDSLSDSALIDSSDGEDDVSITSADRDYLYPLDPTLRYGERSVRCTWCPEMLDKSDLKTPGWWKKHVKEDLDLYVCISENCSNPTVYFKTFSQWHKHMEKVHGSNWAREVYSSYYYCGIDRCRYTIFTNRLMFEQHMIHQHDDELTDAQMQVKLCSNFSASPREQNHCPICNRGVFTRSELRRQLLKLLSRSKERKHVPQPQKGAEVEDSEELSSSDTDESTGSCWIDDTKAQRRKLARHVGRHLEELAFLSIRDFGHTPRPGFFDPESSVPEMSSTDSEAEAERMAREKVWRVQRSAAMTKTYIVAPNFSMRPDALRLGDILRDPLGRDLDPLNRECRIKIDAEHLNAVSIDDSFSATRKALLSGRFGLWSTFLATIGLPVGVDDDLFLEGNSTNIIKAEILETHTFRVTDKYVKDVVQSPSVESVLEIREYKMPIYMVTGLKITKGASVNMGRETNENAKVEPHGPVNVHPSFQCIRKLTENISFNLQAPFILAFRVQRINFVEEETTHKLSVTGSIVLDSSGETSDQLRPIQGDDMSYDEVKEAAEISRVNFLVAKDEEEEEEGEKGVEWIVTDGKSPSSQ